MIMLPKRKKVTIFLFNDLIVITKHAGSVAALASKLKDKQNRYKVKFICKLKESAVTALPDGFQLMSPERTCHFQAEPPVDPVKWSAELIKLKSFLEKTVDAVVEEEPAASAAATDDDDKTPITTDPSEAKWTSGKADSELVKLLTMEVLKTEAAKKQEIRYISVGNASNPPLSRGRALSISGETTTGITPPVAIAPVLKPPESADLHGALSPRYSRDADTSGVKKMMGRFTGMSTYTLTRLSVIDIYTLCCCVVIGKDKDSKDSKEKEKDSKEKDKEAKEKEKEAKKREKEKAGMCR